MEKLLVYQYVWGQNGHSDRIGDLISIVSLDEKSEAFEIEEVWLRSGS